MFIYRRRVRRISNGFEQLQATIQQMMLSHNLINEMKNVHKATNLSMLITANVHIEAEPTNILKKPLILHPASVKTLLPCKVTAIDTGIRTTPINRSITDRLAMKMFPTRTLGFIRWRYTTHNTNVFPIKSSSKIVAVTADSVMAAGKDRNLPSSVSFTMLIVNDWKYLKMMLHSRHENITRDPRRKTSHFIYCSEHEVERTIVPPYGLYKLRFQQTAQRDAQAILQAFFVKQRHCKKWNNFGLIGMQLPENTRRTWTFRAKDLRREVNSPCIFQVIVSLAISIRSFLIIDIAYTGTDRSKTWTRLRKRYKQHAGSS